MRKELGSLRGAFFFCPKVDLDRLRRMDITQADRTRLIHAIASREGNAKELSRRYGYTTDQLRVFVAENAAEIAETAEALGDTETPNGEVTPTQLDQLWISNKFERLRRLQALAEIQYQDAAHGDLIGIDLSTALREFRSYLTLAANELGQLLHRGSGESGTGDVLSVEFTDVDLNNLK